MQTLAQSKERKGSNFAAQRSGAIVQKPGGPNTYDSKNPAIAIWKPCLPGREGGDLLAKVLLEEVIGELQRGLLGTVGPEVAVHAAVHGLTKLVQS